MALTYSSMMPLGTLAPDFDLLGVDGARYTLASFAAAPALGVIFTCNHCPYAQAIEGRLIQLQLEVAALQLVLINPNDAQSYPDDAYGPMQQRAREKGYPFAYLQDDTQAVARAYGAVCTPDIFLFDAARRLAYHGRLDDNWKDASQVQERSLHRAVQSVLAGRAIDFPVSPSMGCSIKWKSA